MTIIYLFFDMDSAWAQPEDRKVARIVVDHPLMRGTVVQLPMARPSDPFCEVHKPGQWQVESEPELVVMPDRNVSVQKVWVRQLDAAPLVTRGMKGRGCSNGSGAARSAPMTIDDLTLPDLQGMIREAIWPADLAHLAFPLRLPFKAHFCAIPASITGIGHAFLHVLPPWDGDSQRNLLYVTFLERHFPSLKASGDNFYMHATDFALMRLTFGKATY